MFMYGLHFKSFRNDQELQEADQINEFTLSSIQETTFDMSNKSGVRAEPSMYSVPDTDQTAKNINMMDLMDD
jgi:hypothetical protein